MSQRMAPEEQRREEEMWTFDRRPAGMAALAVVEREVDELVDDVLDDLPVRERCLALGVQAVGGDTCTSTEAG